MIFNNSLNFINNSYVYSKEKIRSLYLTSNIYNRKITPSIISSLDYFPSPNFLDSFIKYEKKKINIEDYSLNKIWSNKNLNEKDYKKLHSFFWLFSLDLKSSKKDTQNIILQWIENNHRYNSKSWDFDITAKRIIAWTSNSRLTYENADMNYKDNFNEIVKKQTNHLINEIERSEWVDDKMIGCASIILVGISYRDSDKHLNEGLNFLKKIVKSSFNKDGFPKSRSIRQLCFYLKYFILIREWFKESQSEIPDFINENIYYLGQAYAFTWQKNKVDLLFNGNNETNNADFDNYLNKFGYSFKSQNNELGGYAHLNNKKISLIMDIGPSPDKKFSSNYQAGALSFEIISNGKKLICNSGYFQNQNHQLNDVTKSSAIHSTLILDDSSSCKFNKKAKNKRSEIFHGLKILKKNIIFEKNYWKINAAHDGYLKQYGIIHEREIEFYPEQLKFVGNDKIISKSKFKNLKFEIRFHLKPNIKTMKTQDNKSILIDLEGDGWKFNSDNNKMNIDNGLYFGKKDSFVDNQNIVISGMTNDKNHTIKWEITKL